MKKFILFSTMVLSLQATAGIFEGEELLSDQVVSAQNCVSHADEVSRAMGGHASSEVPVDMYTLVIERQVEKEVYKKTLLMKKKEGTSYKETTNKSEVLTFKSESKGSDAEAQRAANLAAKEACEAQRAKFLARDNSERGVVEKSGSQKADQKKTSNAQAQ